MTTDKPSNTCKLLIALCTFNPRKEFIERTLAGLKVQTLPYSNWSLLLIDNASTNDVPDSIDLSWHPRARRVREPILGITPARMRAYAEATSENAEWLLFVDDDTILDPNYLEIGLKLGTEDARLGAWGGQLFPEYEISPPSWLSPLAKHLAIFPLSQDLITDSFEGNHDVLPPTAGMFIRVELAQRYQQMAQSDPLRMALGEQGKNTMRGEDTDLALYILGEGYRLGRFQRLSLTHLMPKERLTIEYMARLTEGIHTGGWIIEHLHGRSLPAPPSLLTYMRQKWQVWRLPKIQGKIFAAELAGLKQAREIIARAPRA